MATRKQIQETAREYIGTPFAHQGRVKGLACDCIGLPLMVAGELGICDVDGNEFTGSRYNVYSNQPLGNYVHDMTQTVLPSKSPRLMQPGDIVSIRFGTSVSHLAIVTEYEDGLGLIHAYSSGAAKVVEHRLDEVWRSRIVGCFEFPGVED